MFRAYSKFIGTIIVVVLAASALASFHSNAASPADFTNANNAINSAFLATYNAQQSGGNVSALVEKLNSAIALVQRAQSENSSSPLPASEDLQSATQLAQQVSSEAPSIGQAGAAAKQTLIDESIAGIVAIGILGALTFFYGGRIYRMLWLLLYGKHLVKQSGYGNRPRCAGNHMLACWLACRATSYSFEQPTLLRAWLTRISEDIDRLSQNCYN